MNNVVFISFHFIDEVDMLVQDNPKLPDDGGETPKSQGKRLAVRFLTVKSPLYLMKNLPSGQLPHVL